MIECGFNYLRLLPMIGNWISAIIVNFTLNSGHAGILQQTSFELRWKRESTVWCVKGSFKLTSFIMSDTFDSWAHGFFWFLGSGYIWFLDSWLLLILGLGLHSLPCVWGTSRRVVPLHSTFFQYSRLSEGLRTSNAASSFEQQNWVSRSDLPKLRLVGIEIHHAWYPSTLAERKYLQTSTKQDSTTMLQIFLPRCYTTNWVVLHPQQRLREEKRHNTYIYALLRSKMDLSGRFRMDHSTL